MTPNTLGRRRFLGAFGGTVGLAALPLEGEATDPVEGGWRMFGGDATRAAYRSDGTYPVDGVSVGRQTDTGALGQTSVVDGVAYTTVSRVDPDYGVEGPGVVRARPIDADSPTWERTWEQDVSTSPVVANGTVYVCHYYGTIRALDAASGETLWTTDVDLNFREQPTVVDGTLYVLGNDDVQRALVAIDAGDGTERWRTAPEHSAVAMPTVVDGTVYLADSAVTAYDAETGDRRWRDTSLNTAFAQPMLSEEDSLYMVGEDTYDHLCQSIDPTDGSVRWQVSLDAESRGIPATDGQTVYVGTDERELVAVDTSDRAIRWRAETVGGLDGQVVVTDEAVYASCDQEFCYAFDPSSGEELWRVQLRETARLSLAADGLLASSYVGTTRLRAGEETDLSADGLSPEWVRRTAAETDSSLVGDGGEVYFTDESGSVYEYNDSGSQIWRSDGEYHHNDEDDPAVGSQNVFVRTEEPGLRAIDEDNGERAWSTEIGDDRTLAPAATGDVVVLVVGLELLAFDTTAGEEVWSSSLTFDPVGVCTHDEAVYVVSADGSRQSLATDGSERWWTAGTLSEVHDVTAAGDSLYLSAEGGVAAVAVDDGSRRWYHRTDERVNGCTAVRDGRVYAGLDDGTVVSVDAASGDVVWETTLDVSYASTTAVVGETVATVVDDERVIFLTRDGGERVGTVDATGSVEGLVGVGSGRAMILDERGSLHGVSAPDVGTSDDGSTGGDAGGATSTGGTTSSGSTPGFTALGGATAAIGAGLWWRSREDE